MLDGYIGGGAGELISGEAMNVLVKKIINKECDKYLSAYGDITIGNCASNNDIQAVAPLDKYGKPYFHGKIY